MVIDICTNIPITSFIKANFLSETKAGEILEQFDLIKDGFNPYYFAYGRQALFTLLQKLPYTKIYFPAFICPTLVEAALLAGKEVTLIDIKPDAFCIDIAKIPQNCECIFVPHIFGNIIDIPTLKRKLPNTYIIEDCAHSLVCGDPRGYGSAESDAILFSLYKQIPNFYGALMLVKKSLSLSDWDFKPVKNSLIDIISGISGPHQLLINWFRQHNYFSNYEPPISFQPQFLNYLVKKLFVVGFLNLHKETEQRKQVRNHYFEIFTENKYYLVDKNKEENKTDIYVFNLLLKPEFIKFRDILLMDLRRIGIFAGRIWFDAPINDKKFIKYKHFCQNAVYASSAIINFPINAQIKKQEIIELKGKIDNFLNSYER